MGTSEQGFRDRLVDEEIRRMVADAVNDGGMISASKCALQIMRAYRGGTLSEKDLVDRIVLAASSAGIAIEFGQAEQKSNQIRKRTTFDHLAILGGDDGQW